MSGSFQSLPKEDSEKSSWSLKTSFWKKIYPINSKTVLTIFSDVRVSMVLGFLAWIS
jgi:hypothetical protein